MKVMKSKNFNLNFLTFTHQIVIKENLDLDPTQYFFSEKF